MVAKTAIQLRSARIKGSHYLLIPKDLARLLEIDDHSVLSPTIEESGNGQRLVYSTRFDDAVAILNESLGGSQAS